MNHKEALTKLADHVGFHGPLADEHERYSLYLAALDQIELWPDLRGCLRDDPNPTMATSVVVSAFDRVPADERRVWADLVRDTEGATSPSNNFLDRRLVEHDILDLVTNDPDAIEGVAERINEVGHTFQRRIVAKTRSPEVLGILAERGSRPTRHAARERLRTLQRPSPEATA